MNDKWDEAGQRAWTAIKDTVTAMYDGKRGYDKMTFDAIASRVGAKNRNVVQQWYAGERGSKEIAFPAMLRYLNNLGLDVLDFIISPGSHRDDKLCEKITENDMLKHKVKELEDKIALLDELSGKTQEDLAEKRMLLNELSKELNLTKDKLIKALEEISEIRGRRIPSREYKAKEIQAPNIPYSQKITLHEPGAALTPADTGHKKA